MGVYYHGKKTSLGRSQIDFNNCTDTVMKLNFVHPKKSKTPPTLSINMIKGGINSVNFCPFQKDVKKQFT